MIRLLLCFILTNGPCVFALTTETGVSFKTSDGLTLNGKMSYPKDNQSGKRIGVLLIHGAGPMDMNLWIPGSVSANGQPHKAFESIAHVLGDKGIITYRYNKRGITDEPNGAPLVDNAIYGAITLDQLIDDASLALKVLQADPNVDPGKIIVLGISQGTLITPRVVKKVGGVAGMILMSSIGSYDNNDSLIASLKLTTLLMHGEIDAMTPIREFNLIVNALKAVGAKNYTTMVYPGLGHGFSPNVNAKPTLGPIEPAVLSDLPVWVNKSF